jgi:hypothetical protein
MEGVMGPNPLGIIALSFSILALLFALGGMFYTFSGTKMPPKLRLVGGTAERKIKQHNHLGASAENDVIFTVGGGKEALRLKADGTVWRNGRQIHKDQELVDGLYEFFNATKDKAK